ncbi:class A beta-lactamase [Crossiella sp. CA198]|uniref:class A beta-lactamase n=1 Tax=Crossiella sp. CA198 TaxID=3455607 RepID=UPI003F8CFF56
MTPSPPVLSRRLFLGAAALLPLAGCAQNPSPAAPPPSAAPATTAMERHDTLVALEQKYGARLGVYALATGSGRTIAHRADERFAFCSTFKGLAAAAILHRNPISHLDTVIRYGKEDLLKNGVITKNNVGAGLTIRQLCDAAVRYSDGTAGNLLLRDLGGPAQLTAYARSLGDEVTRMDRIEPAITEATPGDPRDTTSPRAFGENYRKIVLGDALPPEKRAFLRDLLERNTTGGERIRAGLPKDWKVADKTGTGDYGTLNDFGIAWPPGGEPLVIAIMSSKPDRDAEYKQSLLAEAAAYLAATLR